MYLFFPLATKKMQNDLCCKLDLIPEVTVATNSDMFTVDMFRVHFSVHQD